MLDKNQNLTATDHSKVAGRDLLDHSTNYFSESTKHESTIANVLVGFLNIVSDIKYEKPDTKEYTIEEKVNYNSLTKYNDFFDDYMENYSLVKNKIMIMSEDEPSFENKLINYIRNKYIIPM